MEETETNLPESYKVVYDVKMRCFYPLKIAIIGRGHAAPGWDYIRENDRYGHAAFDTREEAVAFCWQKIHEAHARAGGIYGD